MAETRKFVWANNVTVRLADAIDDSQTAVDLVDGSELPSPGDGEIATLVLKDSESGQYEILNITARSGNSVTVERGAEGTTAAEWPAGFLVRHALTAALFQQISEPATVELTSKPYAVQIIEGIETVSFTAPYDPNFTLFTEGVETGFEFLSGQLREPIATYSDALPEAVETDEFDFLSGTLRVALLTYEDALPEAVETVEFDFLSGTLRVAIIAYTNALPEAVESGFDFISGSLT